MINPHAQVANQAMPIDGMPVNPNFLAQSGGDAQRACVVVNQAIRDLVQSGNYGEWRVSINETDKSNATKAVYSLQVGDGSFTVTVAKEV
jgi:hypothetical protein